MISFVEKKKKKGTNELSYKAYIGRLGLAYTLLYIKQIINKDLLYNTGNCIQYSVMAYMEIES